MIELHIGWLIGLVLAVVFMLPVLVWVSSLGIRNVSHQLDQESQNRREDIRLLQAIVTDMIDRVDRSLARHSASWAMLPSMNRRSENTRLRFRI